MFPLFWYIYFYLIRKKFDISHHEAIRLLVLLADYKFSDTFD